MTKYNGKIQVKAPGVRKITSRRSSHIELLNLSLLTLYKSSKSFLPLITEAQVLDNFAPIKKDLKKVGFAYYTCELVDKFCPDTQENKRVFNLFSDTLTQLAISSDEGVIVDQFENDLLFLLGYLPKSHAIKNKQEFIEGILERRLASKKLLPLFLRQI